jgi:hypothetical protein
LKEAQRRASQESLWSVAQAPYTLPYKYSAVFSCFVFNLVHPLNYNSNPRTSSFPQTPHTAFNSRVGDKINELFKIEETTGLATGVNILVNSFLAFLYVCICADSYHGVRLKP